MTTTTHVTNDLEPPSGFNRHHEALQIVDPGACNPSGIAIALSRACRQVIDEGGTQRTDPAVRLIGLQLASVLEVGGIIDPTEYARLTAACRARSAETASAAKDKT